MDRERCVCSSAVRAAVGRPVVYGDLWVVVPLYEVEKIIFYCNCLNDYA